MIEPYKEYISCLALTLGERRLEPLVTERKYRLATSRPHEFLSEQSEFFRPQSSHANDEVVRSSRAILNQKKDFLESLRVSSVSGEFSSTTPNNDNYMDDNNGLFTAYFISNAWFFICDHLQRLAIAQHRLTKPF